MSDPKTAQVELKILRIKARQSVIIALGKAAIWMNAQKAILLSDELVRAAVEVQPDILEVMNNPQAN